MTDLLQINNVNKSFLVTGSLFRKRKLDVLRGINIQIEAGEVAGLVGESGSGKTTLARIVMGMEQPDDGHVIFDGSDLTGLTKAQLRIRRRDIAMVYQNPFVSLNPRFSVFDLVGEPITAHEKTSRTVLQTKVSALLNDVGLDDSYLDRRIGQMSGGQAQRVAIARALALRPKLIILDEPTSALDVSVQAQILNLLTDLRAQDGFTMLIITHNLDVVRHMADRVMVMSAGEIIEQGDAEEILTAPKHAYTQALIAATPTLD
ncbi:ATP-binding cassette domain-containing protein [Octadecabacter sp.]|nr:ATP-binding cassette domain-containing protein [Octadecabacter sp.]MDC1501383.1 ATP-binding cassette domain-containing protein [Octadecabacter sp.]